MSRSAVKLHTPAGRKALDKMIQEAERKAQAAQLKELTSKEWTLDELKEKQMAK